MRALLLLLLYVSVARADGISAGAAIGAGGQGDATYGGIDLGIDAQWKGARLGLGGRAVWLDGEWRDRDWQSAQDAVRAVRLLEIRAGWFALAGGALAPAQVARGRWASGRAMIGHAPGPRRGDRGLSCLRRGDR